MKKKGEILIENVVFIILNIMFLSIMILFIINQSSGKLTILENSAKEVALIVDSSRPGMIITLDTQDLYSNLKETNYPFNRVFDFSNNYVTVRLSEDKTYSYHYFNSVLVNSYPEEDLSGNPTGNYILVVSSNE